MDTNLNSNVTDSKRVNDAKGFVLVILLAAIAFAGIFITKAIPNAAVVMQRDQEDELIFRGEAIGKAIALYQKRMGCYPTQLEDLVNIEPKIIRKLYKDPMTISGEHKGDWDLIKGNKNGKPSFNGLYIVGVRSFCKKDSKKVYQGTNLVSDWMFVADDRAAVMRMLQDKLQTDDDATILRWINDKNQTDEKEQSFNNW